MPRKRDPDKATSTTIHDIIGKDEVDAILDEIRADNPRQLVALWTTSEHDALRWHSSTMTDAMFIYLLEVTKYEFFHPKEDNE